MLKPTVRGGDIIGLLAGFAQLQDKAQARTRRHIRLVVIQEAGLDGFWVHRILEAEGMALLATNRRAARVRDG